jgi:FixJ family two-component response regulator
MNDRTPDVLLIEDDEAMRVANEQALMLADVEVLSFERAEEAAAWVNASFSGAVVSDVRLPGRSGLDLLEDVMRIDPGIPVILVTGHGDVPLAVEAMRSGAYDFIEKPFHPDRLVDVVHRALTLRRSALSQRSDPLLSWSALTEREHEVTQWVAAGKTNSEVAQIVGIAEGTVKRHLTHVFEKLGLSSRAQLVRHMTERGLSRARRLS